MTVERASELAGKLSPALRRFELGYDAGVYIGPTIFGALSGAAALCVTSFALTPWLTKSVFAAAPLFTAHGDDPAASIGLAAIVGTVGTIVFRYFQQGHVEITVDEEGIRETEAGKTRLFVPWREARGFHHVRRTKRRDTGQLFDATWVRFAGPSGEQIVVTDADEGLAMPTYPRRTVVRASVAELAAIAAELPALDAKELDPRKSGYEGSIGLRVATTASLVVLVGMFYRLFEVYGFSASLGPPLRPVSFLDATSASVVVGVAALVRTIVPFRHWRAFAAQEATRRASGGPAPAGSAYRDSTIRRDETDAEARKYEGLRVRGRLAGRLATAVFLAVATLLAHGR